MAQTETGQAVRHLRDRDAGEQRATTLELFFDLVYVFAITQLSHYLLEHLTFAGAARTLLLLLVVWWAWVYTTWMTNWFDPTSIAVRALLIGVMLVSLLMAIAIPNAYGERGLLFAASYAALQIVRNAFVVAVTEEGSQLRHAFVRITTWSVVVGAIYVTGALLDGDARWIVWLGALALDYAGPYAGYFVPRLGRSPSSDWQIESSHFAERFQLFIIIALGESIVVTGATASDLDIDFAHATAIALAFLGTAALWWLYFDYQATIAERRLRLADDRGKLARDAYTYIHIPIVAGIIATAVGDELVIAHPDEGLTGAELTALVGGPAFYLLGNVLFRKRMAGSWGTRRPTAIVALVLAGFLGLALPALATAALVVAVLVGLILVEAYLGYRRRARGEPSPLELLERQAAGRTSA